MKLAIKLVETKLTVVPYENNIQGLIPGFPKEDADQMCKQINESDDPLFIPYHWEVEEWNHGGIILWLIVTSS
jgi:hypothetical protein